MRFFRKKLPYTKQISINAPAPSPERHGIAIVACVKNEADYLEEWLRYHKAVGIRRFYLYLDHCTDDTASVIDSMREAVDICLIPWAGRMVDTSTENILNSQAIAFAHSILNFGADFRWMAFIDVDEFLLPKQTATVEEALTAAGGFPNISLPWHMFGSDGHIRKPSNGVLRNYTRRASNPLSDLKNVRNYKCIVDPASVTEVSIHQFSTKEHGELTANDAGFVTSRKGRKKSNFYSAANLQLNHYYGKSREELERKLARGPASPASRARYEERVRSAVANIESDLVEDRAMIDFLDRIGLD